MLSIKNLDISFYNGKEQIRCTDRVCFDVQAGEIVALVGESGCGKSITALSILRLLGRNARVGGEVLFEGSDLLKLSEKEMDSVRGQGISMIFQDIMYSLNPVFTIGNQMVEGMRRHLKYDRAHAYGQAVQLLQRVGIQDAPAVMKKYPHQLSGGMRQRVMIAMALSCKPRLLIADEPTTALDVTIQLQIMQLLKSLRDELGMAILIITHDIALVAEMADRVVVMYAGQCVEQADVKALLEQPQHPYTKALLSAVPDVNGDRSKRLYAIPGTVPEDYHRMQGCRFAPRCEYAEGCARAGVMHETADGRQVRCDLVSKGCEAGE
jgi:oligopeptide/dipeptide ABC transporter ATP-binding protein